MDSEETPRSLDGAPVAFRGGDRIHSGDTIFFEGLPFHYLETKDVEVSGNAAVPMGWVA